MAHVEVGKQRKFFINSRIDCKKDLNAKVLVER